MWGVGGVSVLGVWVCVDAVHVQCTYVYSLICLHKANYML